MMPAADPFETTAAASRRWPWLVVGLGLALGAVALGVHRGPLGLRPPASSEPPVADAPLPPVGDLSSLGEGFVVWESRRAGAWRIWSQDLSGGAPRQVSPEEPGRNHCCAQISPDGRRIAYLSVDERTPYGEDDEPGSLHLLVADGSEGRQLVERARTYGRGHRAALWHDDRRLGYIAGDGSAQLLDTESGMSTPLAPPSSEAGGWLVNATRTHATAGIPTFSPYDSNQRTVAPRTALGGCEPVFSHDGRFGIWVAGAGGPLYALDLHSRTVTTLLQKNDPRLQGSGYVYFPSLARSGDVLAFGASAGEHDHTRGNYEIYLAEVVSATLRIVGPPIRVTNDPGSDRYPDVHVEPLALGRHAGEAPFTVSVATAGTTVTESYASPGSYTLTTVVDGRDLRGRVNVVAAAAPRPLAVSVRRGRELVVLFDEPIAAAAAAATLASGRTIASISAHDSTLLLVLAAAAADLDRADSLTLTGISDLAQRPNTLATTTLPVPPPTWPSDRRGLRMLWERADRPNLVPDPSGGEERSWALRPHGRARLDHDFAMSLVGQGFFEVDPAAAATLATMAKASNEIGIELTLAPARLRQTGTILAFAKPRGEPNLKIEQRGTALVLRLLTAKTAPPVELTSLPSGTHHLAVSYGPGELTVWLDGVRVHTSQALQRDFFRWQNAPLTCGGSATTNEPWAGSLAAVALYDRRLRDDEIAENHRRLGTARAAVATVPRLVVEARQVGRSTAPSLAEIAPYREALVTHLYKITAVIEGTDPGPLVRVAHWAILDGEAQTLAGSDGPRRLTLEPYALNLQISGTVLRDDLDQPQVPLFLDLH